MKSKKLHPEDLRPACPSAPAWPSTSLFSLVTQHVSTPFASSVPGLELASRATSDEHRLVGLRADRHADLLRAKSCRSLETCRQQGPRSDCLVCLSFDLIESVPVWRNKKESRPTEERGAADGAWPRSRIKPTGGKRSKG